MADVVNFPVKERKIWVCNCGCSTFELMNDGNVRCAMCEVESSNEGGWSPMDSFLEWQGDAPIREVQGNGDEEFTRRVTIRRAGDKDVTAIVVVKSHGMISVWGDISGDEQLQWVKRRLDDSKELFDTMIREQN